MAEQCERLEEIGGITDSIEKEFYGSEHEIILSHREHGRRLAWSFLSGWRMRMNQDEVNSVVGMALCEAAKRFDREKGVSFKTFFFYHLRGLLLKEISRIIKDQRQLCTAQPGEGTEYALATSAETLRSSLVEKNTPEKIVQQRQLAKKVWDACETLDIVEQEVLIRYLIFDEPLNSIAKDMKYCRCHVSRVKSRALSKLAKLLDSKEDINESSSGPELRERISVDRRAKLTSLGYTGGRGRRRRKKLPEKSQALKLVMGEGY